ncbi:hypothetical protein SFRURICE_012935 [Spodoptera frugiperda]|nr:hypothetical protein SFRURICE_012935 [Spodoptera frugiperda]
MYYFLQTNNDISYKLCLTKHNYESRHKDRLSQPFFRLTKISKSFIGFCVKCYNKIPEEIKHLNERQFKLCYKKTMCRLAYYKLNDYTYRG